MAVLLPGDSGPGFMWRFLSRRSWQAVSLSQSCDWVYRTSPLPSITRSLSAKWTHSLLFSLKCC